MLAKGTVKLIASIVPTAAAPNRPPVPTRRNRTFGTVITKSRRAVALNAPPPVCVEDSALASIGVAMAAMVDKAKSDLVNAVFIDRAWKENGNLTEQSLAYGTKLESEVTH